ncbi:MAG: hypothetical protein U1D55_00950 [Phycisphaerae bacterium]
MLRNVVVLIATIGILAALFVGYERMTRSEPPPRGVPAGDVARLPERTQRAADELVKVGPVTVPGGGRVEFTRYDPNTGRPTERMLLDEWTPVPDSKNEIRVTKPELVMLMPSGMVASVSAERGQITVDRVQRTDMKPKMGWLEGDAKIVIQRRKAYQPQSQPADAAASEDDSPIEIRLGRLEFDLELGQLRSKEPMHVEGDDFDIRGTGLQLEWNRAANRVETLLIEHGDELTYYVANGVFGVLGDPQAELAASPSSTPTGAAPKPKRERDSNGVTYLCLIKEQVQADHFRGAQRIGGLTADQLTLLFDLGGRAGRMLDRRRPASRPAAEERERLVLHWRGSLTLGPSSDQRRGGEARRRLVAEGAPLQLDIPNGAIRCGKLAYQDESQQLWLYRLGDQPVEFTLNQRITALAQTIYVDRGRNLIKLIGDVRLSSPAKEAGRGMAVRATEWAELLVEPETRPASRPSDAAPTDFGEYGRLRSAAFVGNVRIRLDRQELSCHRLEAAFRPGAGDQPIERLLESAIASEDVRLKADTQSLDCGWMRLAFASDASGRAYPREVEARGAVRMRDRVQKAAARGETLAATVSPEGSVTKATVRGGKLRDALAAAYPYAVRGERIELDPPAQRMTVLGTPRLFARTARSLQGDERNDPTPLWVSCNESIEIDGRANTAVFNGQVAARTGQEQLLGDAMTLEMEDVPLKTAAPRAAPTDDLFRAARAVWEGRDPRAAPTTRPALAAEPQRTRKEPRRLLVHNGVMSTATFVPGDSQPVVQASIQGPEMVVLMRERIVRTSGQTRLLLVNRRMAEDDEKGVRDTLGVPSALMTRGPSQTAMQCSKAMTYSLGPEKAGAARQDNVLFEGDVLFVHRAGREMLNLEQMLPQVVNRPELLAKLKSRVTVLQSDRVEARFESEDARQRVAAAPMARPLRLGWLMAQGNVQLSDQQGPGLREVTAQQIEFDRPQSIVRVLGASGADARITYQNTQTQRFDTPAIGPAFTIDLTKNTVRTGAVSGEVRR